MKLVPIIHQQVMQLRWHIAACLGLIMALPLEEAFINLWEGQGFYAGSLTLAVPLVASPLIAGLIACANIQADFDEKRFFFWRSKPAGIKSFMFLKYFIGLLSAFAVIALPFLFAFITCKFVQPDEIQKAFFEAVIMVQSVSLLTYSLCFLCNVLIRKTARAWLVGMALTGFLMVIPFILPLNLKTIDDVFDLLGRKWSFIWVGHVITGVPSLAAFILSVVAAARNWHLHTNLKGLLWAAAGLALALMLLFTRQIANIRILDQVTTPETFRGKLYTAGDQIIAPGIANVSISHDNRIQIEPMPLSSQPLIDQVIQIYPRQEDEDDLHYRTDGWANNSFYKSGDSIYTYSFDLYFREIEIEEKKRSEYEKLTLRISQFEGGRFVPQSFVDLSEYIVDKDPPFNLIRRVGDKLILVINRNILVGQIQADGRLEIIEKKPGQLARYSPHYNPPSFEEAFSIPLVPVERISVEERIRLSIDLNFCSWWGKFDRSQVNIDSEGIFFFLVGNSQIGKYKVIRWDDKKVWCRFVENRPFRVLETLLTNYNTDFYEFVRNQKLYVYGDSRLLVFDIRSGIRKLGHFERITNSGGIQDVEVLPDGRILLSTVISRQTEKGDWQTKCYLYVLKDPE